MIEFEKYKAYYFAVPGMRNQKCEMGKEGELAKTTFIDAFNFFTEKGRTLLEIPDSIGAIKCNDGDYEVRSDRPYCVDHLLRLALSLSKENIPMFSCAWYFIEKDECMDSPMRRNRFFLSYEGNIVRESVSLTDCMDMTLDMFESFDDGKKIWMDENRNRDARAHRMYEKFYESTETGKFHKTKERLAAIAENSEEPELTPDTVAIMHAIHANTSCLKTVGAIMIGAILVSLFWR